MNNPLESLGTLCRRCEGRARCTELDVRCEDYKVILNELYKVNDQADALERAKFIIIGMKKEELKHKKMINKLIALTKTMAKHP